MRDHCSYDYAVIRVVPRVDREEFMNVGVIMSCPAKDFLEARIEIVEAVRAHLASIPRICAGGPDAGPIGQLSARERFHWLVAPRSTIIQTSRVHSGRCTEPGPVSERLLDRVVRSAR